jgi:hypothetical protein
VKKSSKNGEAPRAGRKPASLQSLQIKKRAQQKRSFLRLMRDTGGNVSRSCESAGISRPTAYEWRESDPEFAAQWNQSVEFGTDELEEEARRRAFAGVDEPVFYQGEECGTVRKYSDTLLIFLLKGRKPDKYRERVSIDVNKLDADIERELALIAAGSQAGNAGEAEGEAIH